ncbi:serine hydrolase, partial [uncultured Schumannella sp.]|uniref:serine hydrolase domain-containing protein n=1 Tax=uncultured Schumannella sp. TaxID=1195956 RepID=UPI0025DE1237
EVVVIETAGFVASGYESVADAWSEDPLGLDTGGTSLAVYRHGQLVLDLWGGTDPISRRPWERESCAIVFSCTKAVTAVALLRLVDRGLVDLDAPVARYWPEFARNGKGAITVRHVLTHRSGLPSLGITDRRELLDPIAMAAMLADRSPVHPPGRHWLYHALSFGYLLGEIVRRVTGRSIGTLIQDEISGPLGLDLWIGTPTERGADFRPAHSARPLALSAEPDDPIVAAAWLGVREVLELAIPQPGEDRGGEFINSRRFRAAEIAAGNGVATARSLARFYAACIGEVDGIRLLSADLLDEATTDQAGGTTVAPGQTERMHYGLGLDLAYRENPMLGPHSFGHAGMGGRLAFADRHSGLAVGYVSTELRFGESPDRRWMPLLAALRAVAG